MMKVTGPTGSSAASPTRAAGRVQGGFSLDAGVSAGGITQTAPTSAATGVSSIDALLALQAVGTPEEGRRRAVKRGGRILDVLDEIKVGLLDGAVPQSALDRLISAVREQRESTDDPRLNGVLDEIETRAAVEIAKLEQMQKAA